MTDPTQPTDDDAPEPPRAGADYSFAALAGLTRDAEGRNLYNFDGHVRARGLDLDASTGIDGTDENRVRWLSQADGSLVAELYSYDLAGAANRRFELNLWDGELLEDLIQLSLDAGAPGGIKSIRAAVGAGNSRTLLDEHGQSSFARWAGTLGDLRFGLYATTLVFDNDVVSNLRTVAHNLEAEFVFPFAQIATQQGVREDLYVVVDAVDSFDVDLLGLVGNHAVTHTGSVPVWVLVFGLDTA